MTTYYVGKGGSDAADGLTWANRKLTLNGAEDIPVAASDTVYVGPGAYREQLTLDVSGTAGNPITYIGDWTGANTDGVGGTVRVTGTDDDQFSGNRNYCILDNNTARNYRTFRGFLFDGWGLSGIRADGTGTNWIIEDCVFSDNGGGASIRVAGASQASWTIRRCFFWGGQQWIDFTHSSVVNNTSHAIQNCLFFGGGGTSGGTLRTTRVGGIAIKNCTYRGGVNAVIVAVALDTGQTVTINNCFLSWLTVALQGTVTGEIVEDYNNFFWNQTNRTSTATGANSTNGQMINPLLPNVFNTIRSFQPWHMFMLNEWSIFRGKTGSSPATDDFYGVTRPTTGVKISWGAIQSPVVSRETTTVRSGNSSLKLPDAGRHQIVVPHDGNPMTFNVYCRREANHSGTAPQMIIRQPGQTAVTVTDGGSSGAWNLLTQTVTPATNPGFVIVELVSNNTATSGSYAVFFDDLRIL